MKQSNRSPITRKDLVPWTYSLNFYIDMHCTELVSLGNIIAIIDKSQYFPSKFSFQRLRVVCKSILMILETWTVAMENFESSGSRYVKWK